MNDPNLDALIGGMLIGVAVTIMLWFNGRITGNSGIIGGIYSIHKDRGYWRLFYMAGLVLGAFGYEQISRGVPIEIDASVPVLVVAGLLVGYGTRLGSGCTAGHGICGMARFSKRSVVATLIFIGTAMITVWLTKQI